MNISTRRYVHAMLDSQRRHGALIVATDALVQQSQNSKEKSWFQGNSN